MRDFNKKFIELLETAPRLGPITVWVNSAPFAPTLHPDTSHDDELTATRETYALMTRLRTGV